jgi:hypothetical protein
MRQKYNITANIQPSLVGNFQREGNTLIAQGVKLLISERKQPTPNKPKYFLVDKVSNQYVSSLFETEGLYTYRFDFKGVKYLLTLNSTQATIKLLTSTN